MPSCNPRGCSIPHLLFTCHTFDHERYLFMEAHQANLDPCEFNSLTTCDVGATAGLLSGEAFGGPLIGAYHPCGEANRVTENLVWV